MSTATIPPVTRWRQIGLVGLAIVGWMIALYALVMLFAPTARPEFVQDRFARSPLATALHFIGGAVALLLGPIQFSRNLRARNLTIHRWSGRTYVVACLLGGVMGLLLAPTSSGGMVAHVGFGLLGAFWIVATSLGYLAIRRGERVAHYRWMVRSFALTLAAVSLRIYLPASFAVGIDFGVAYPVIAWAAWVPNLLLAEWLLHRPAAVREALTMTPAA